MKTLYPVDLACRLCARLASLALAAYLDGMAPAASRRPARLASPLWSVPPLPQQNAPLIPSEARKGAVKCWLKPRSQLRAPRGRILTMQACMLHARVRPVASGITRRRLQPAMPVDCSYNATSCKAYARLLVDGARGWRQTHRTRKQLTYDLSRLQRSPSWFFAKKPRGRREGTMLAT